MLNEGLRPRHLLTIAAGVFLGSAIVWRLYTRSGRLLPSPTWLTLVVVLVLTGLVLWSGWQVRDYQRGAARREFTALRAARTLRLAQAASLTGSAVAGWFLGHLAILLPDRDLTPYGRQLVPLLLIIAAAGVLVVAGLLAQRWCRLPEDPTGSDDSGGLPAR